MTITFGTTREEADHLCASQNARHGEGTHDVRGYAWHGKGFHLWGVLRLTGEPRFLSVEALRVVADLGAEKSA